MITFYWKSKHATLIDEEVFVIFFIPLGVLWLGGQQTCSRIAERCCPSSQLVAAHAGAAARGLRVLRWSHSGVQHSPVSRQTGASLVSAPAQRRSSPRTGRKPVEASYARWICDAILPFRPSISALTVPGTRSMEGGQRTVSTCPANTLLPKTMLSFSKVWNEPSRRKAYHVAQRPSCWTLRPPRGRHWRSVSRMPLSTGVDFTSQNAWSWSGRPSVCRR